MGLIYEKGLFTRYCDVCQAEVLGLLTCDCGYNEHIYCEEHACRCSDRETA